MTNVEEIFAFIGCEIFMGIYVLPQLRDYWSHPWRLGLKEIAGVMSMLRFAALHHFLHVNDNRMSLPGNSPGRDKMHKVTPFLNLIQENSLKQYQTYEAYKIWIHTLGHACPRTGYTFAMEPYTGKVSDKETVIHSFKFLCFKIWSYASASI